MINFVVLALGCMTTCFLLSSMLLEVIDPNIDPDLELNLIYLDLDLNLILFIKEKLYDDKQVTMNL